jgi:3-deoxy-manno-octulosonate cytidylyltransferase (CMP-KDO synthetase)
MLVRVAESVASSGRFSRVVVAVEDGELAAALEPWGLDVVVTGPAVDGTSRVAAVAPSDRAVVNVQGDQPFIGDDVLGAIVGALGDGVVTPAAPWVGDPHDPARVKVLPGPDFSRGWSPGARLHVGVYGFGPGWVHRCASLPQSARAKEASLEQLTWLDAGVPLRVVDVQSSTASVDTPADLEAVRRWLAAEPRHQGAPGAVR